MFNWIEKSTLIVATVQLGSVFYLSRFKSLIDFDLSTNKNKAFKFKDIKQINKSLGFNIKNSSEFLVIDFDDTWTKFDIEKELGKC